jgi:hypothetical protein
MSCNKLNNRVSFHSGDFSMSGQQLFTNKIKRNILTVSFVVFTVAIMGCAGGGEKGAKTASFDPFKYALQWKPVSSDANYTVAALGLYKDLSFEIGEFSDVRENKSLIGYTLPDKKIGAEYKPVETGTDVAAWCGKAVASSLEILDLHTSSNGSGVILDGEIHHLTAKEETAFHGEVTLRISARKGESMMIWEGMISGESNVPEYSYTTVDCSKALSEAVINAVYNLLIETSFSDAIAKIKEN